MLAEEAGGQLKPLQELHFVHSERQIETTAGEDSLKIVPCLQGITKPANRDYSKMVFEKFVSGSCEDVVSQWNKMTEISGSISAVRIRFTQNAGRDAVNCRTGTKAVLKALGYDFKPLVDNATSGINSCVLDKIKDVIVDATPRVFSPEEMQKIRQSFLLNFDL